MKYMHKCPHCSRSASKRYRGVWFCDEHYRYNRRTKASVYVTESLVQNLESGISVYAIKFH